MAKKKNSAVQYDAETMSSIAARAGGIVESLQCAARDASALMESLQNYDALPLEERWVKTWGETMTMTKAARIMSVGHAKIRALVEAGELATTPDGRILVRQMCRWANGGATDSSKGEKRSDRSPRVLPPSKRFIP